MIAESAPAFRESDRPLAELAGLCLARVEAGALHVGDRFDGDLERRVRLWVQTAARILDSLGMSPTARARLGLDVARAAQAGGVTITELAELAREERAE